MTENVKLATSKTADKGLLRKAASKLIAIAKQKDTPHRIALGLALGIFIGVLPIMGIQMVVVTLVAIPLRGNLKAAIAGVWISNPVTFIPMYWSYYRFGLLFTPSRRISWDHFYATMMRYSDWDEFLETSTDILVPMWIGAGILAVVFAIPTYLFTYRFVIRYRALRARRRARRVQRG